MQKKKKCKWYRTYVYKYIKKLFCANSYVLVGAVMIYLININPKRNLIKNEANWNILIALGKEIKRDSIISVNESR